MEILARSTNLMTPGKIELLSGFVSLGCQSHLIISDIPILAFILSFLLLYYDSDSSIVNSLMIIPSIYDLI